MTLFTILITLAVAFEAKAQFQQTPFNFISRFNPFQIRQQEQYIPIVVNTGRAEQQWQEEQYYLWWLQQQQGQGNPIQGGPTQGNPNQGGSNPNQGNAGAAIKNIRDRAARQQRELDEEEKRFINWIMADKEGFERFWNDEQGRRGADIRDEQEYDKQRDIAFEEAKRGQTVWNRQEDEKMVNKFRADDKTRKDKYEKEDEERRRRRKEQEDALRKKEEEQHKRIRAEEERMYNEMKNKKG